MPDVWFAGIDQSYTGFGLTFINEEGSTHHSVKKAFPASKYGEGVKRLFAIQEWLTMRFQDFDVTAIAMEGYAHGAKFGREQAGELGAAVKLALAEQFHPAPTIVPPTSVKKFATGKGTAKKNEILLQVFKRWGVEFSDDNMADSYVLAQIARSIHGEDFGFLTKFQQEIVTGLKAPK